MGVASSRDDVEELRTVILILMNHSDRARARVDELPTRIMPFGSLAPWDGKRCSAPGDLKAVRREYADFLASWIEDWFVSAEPRELARWEFDEPSLREFVLTSLRTERGSFGSLVPQGYNRNNALAYLDRSAKRLATLILCAPVTPALRLVSSPDPVAAAGADQVLTLRPTSPHTTPGSAAGVTHLHSLLSQVCGGTFAGKDADPHLFGATESPLEGPYIPRRVEEELRDSFDQPKMSLLLGEPKSGKSRTVAAAVAAWRPTSTVIVPRYDQASLRRMIELLNEICTIDPGADFCVYFDDLDLYVHEGAISLGDLDALLALHPRVTTVATVADASIAQFANGLSSLGPAAKAFFDARHCIDVVLDRALNDAELQTAVAAYPHLRSLLESGYGIAEAIIGGPRLSRKIRKREGGAHGWAVSTAAIAWFGCGLRRPIPEGALRELYRRALARSYPAYDPANFDIGLQWALEPESAAISILVRAGEDAEAVPQYTCPEYLYRSESAALVTEVWDDVDAVQSDRLTIAAEAFNTGEAQVAWRLWMRCLADRSDRGTWVAALRGIGLWWRAAGEPRRARACFQRVVREALPGESPFALSDLLAIFHDAGDLLSAERWWRECWSRLPRDQPSAQLSYDMGRLYFEFGELADAGPFLEEAARASDGLISPRAGRALAMDAARRGDIEYAVAWYEWVRGEDDAQEADLAGVALIRLLASHDRLDDALACHASIVEGGNEESARAAHHSLAHALASTGDADSARAAFLAAHEGDSSSVAVEAAAYCHACWELERHLPDSVQIAIAVLEPFASRERVALKITKLYVGLLVGYTGDAQLALDAIMRVPVSVMAWDTELITNFARLANASRDSLWRESVDIHFEKVVREVLKDTPLADSMRSGRHAYGLTLIVRCLLWRGRDDQNVIDDVLKWIFENSFVDATLSSLASIVDGSPNPAAVYHLLGHVCAQVGSLGLAADCYQQAIKNGDKRQVNSASAHLVTLMAHASSAGTTQALAVPERRIDIETISRIFAAIPTVDLGAMSALDAAVADSTRISTPDLSRLAQTAIGVGHIDAARTLLERLVRRRIPASERAMIRADLVYLRFLGVRDNELLRIASDDAAHAEPFAEIAESHARAQRSLRTLARRWPAPMSSHAHLMLGVISVGDPDFAAGELRIAVASTEQISNLVGRHIHVSALSILAFLQIQTGRLDEARRLIDRAIAKSPQSPPPVTYLARIFRGAFVDGRGEADVLV